MTKKEMIKIIGARIRYDKEQYNGTDDGDSYLNGEIYAYSCCLQMLTEGTKR